MDKIKLIFILMPLSLSCFSLELGGEFLSAKSYSDQFRALLINKIKQMDQNFIKEVDQLSIRYISRNEEHCLDDSHVSANQNLMHIEYSKELKKSIYNEVRSYYGCNGKIAFQETLLINGIDKEYHSNDDLLNNKMKFENAKDYNVFEYNFLDNSGEKVFSILSQSNTVETYRENEMNFLINNQTLFKRMITKGDWVSYTTYPIHFKMNRNGYRFESRGSRRFDNQIKAKILKNNIEYYDPKGRRISLAKFQESFIIDGFNFIMDSFLAYYPQTSFVTSNLQSSKLLNELRDAQTFLINGVQLNLVRNLIEEYIEAVQKGEIVDNRK